MINKKSVADYCNENFLKIPQALHFMRDVKLLAESGHSIVFYKCLEKDLIDVEFYTNNSCLVYIQSGQERITSADNVSIVLQLFAH